MGTVERPVPRQVWAAAHEAAAIRHDSEHVRRGVGPAAGGRAPGCQLRERRAHPGRLRRRARRRCGGPGVRRPSDRRRAPRVRARPGPAAYRRQARRDLDDGPRRARARSTSPRGRTRGPTSTTRPPSATSPSTGCSPCASCWRLRPTTTAGSSWPSRPSTPPATAGWSRSGWSRPCATSGGAGSAPPVRVMSFSLTALSRVDRMAPEVPLVILLDKTAMWPVLRRMIGKDWLVGPGIDLLREEPDLARRIAPPRPRHARVDREHPRRTSSCASTSASRPSSATARRVMLHLLGGARGGCGAALVSVAA